MGYETILVEKKEQITRITLNRPVALNSFDDKMGEEFYRALKEAERDEGTRCLIITGAGRAFSAGEDVSGLKERYGGDSRPSLGDHLRKKYHPMILRIRNMEKPVIARINGDRKSTRSEEHTSELQSLTNFVCRLLLEKRK